MESCLRVSRFTAFAAFRAGFVTLNDDIVDLINQTLLVTVTQALVDMGGHMTVFAPDDAFGALPGLLDALLTPGFKKHLTEILFVSCLCGWNCWLSTDLSWQISRAEFSRHRI
jgi:hypothetical protein